MPRASNGVEEKEFHFRTTDGLQQEEALLIANNNDYERFIRPIEDRMMRSVWRVLGDPDEAEDALQEALATIWKRLGRIRRHPNPHALILRICANAAYDALRRRTRRRHAFVPVPGDLEDDSRSAAEEVIGREQRDEVLRAVGRLSRKQAAAILMRAVQEQSYRNIAQALGCSEATARTHVARARARLRQLLSHLLPQGSQVVFP